VAKVVFQQLVTGSYASLKTLGQALYQTGLERHIIFWSNRPTAELSAQYFGASGALPEPDQTDYALLTVQNFGKNKLDYYLDTSLQLAGDRPAGDTGHVTATITLSNTAPTRGVSAYIFGGEFAGQVPGRYDGVVSLYLPSGSTLVGSSGDEPSLAPVLTTELGRTVVAFGMNVPAGQSRTLTLNLTLPPRPSSAYGIVVEPIPRVRPTKVGIDFVLGDGRHLARNLEAITEPTLLGDPTTGTP
jgi:hypothetical protein